MRKDNKHTENTDYFDYLSEQEIEKITDADMEDLFNRIDKRITGTSLPKTNYFSVVLITGFSCMLFLILFKKNEILQIGSKSLTNISKPADILSKASVLDTIYAIAQYTDKTDPAGKKEKKEHFSISERDRHFTEDLNIDILPSHPILTIDSNSAKPALTETMLNMLPNASVLYIYDLKVTEFQKLYFRKMKPYVINEKGLSSAFENAEDYKTFLKEQRGPSYTLDELLKDALKAFNQHRLRLAFSYFQELLTYNENDVNALFYSGLCQYESGNFMDAVKRFDRVIDNENNVFDQEAEWYKALCLAGAKKHSEAIEVLIGINVRKGFYADRAGEKLKELGAVK